MRILGTVLAVLFACLPAVAFDRVLLKDGRVIDGKLIESDDGDFTVLRLPGADVPIPNHLIDKTYVEDLADYVPKNDKEAKQLEQGKVLFEGVWMSKQRREQSLQKRADADRSIIDKLRSEQQWKNHKQISTRHFDIFSNCSDEVLADYSARIEQYYDVFVDYWNIKLSPSEGKSKMKFYLYRTKPDFHQVTGVPNGVGGFFDFTERHLQLYDDVDNPEEARDTMQHEGNHLLTYLIDTKFEYPRWMNEGMAEYFGTAEIDEKNKIKLGGLQYSRIASLRSDRTNDRVIPMRSVLMATPKEYGYRQYAYGWSFVHFLMESPKYGKTFKLFFKNIANNRDIDVTNTSYSNVKGALATPDLASVASALEKELGKSVEELEAEMQQYAEQAYGELSAYGYFRAARMSRREKLPGDEHVRNALRYYDKACALGYENDTCYREYAEMLRKGGIDEAGYSAVVQPLDGEKAWAMCQRAIELDPIDPFNYCEAAGALMLDGPAQDLDRAYAMAQTGLALAPRSAMVKSLYDELMSMIEPARERARERAELEARLAASDPRRWTVQPFFYENQEKPETTPELSTEELKALVKDGKFKATDWVFQAYRWPDQATGELKEGTEPWDLGWVKLSDVPVFADALAASATN